MKRGEQWTPARPQRSGNGPQDPREMKAEHRNCEGFHHAMLVVRSHFIVALIGIRILRVEGTREVPF